MYGNWNLVKVEVVRRCILVDALYNLLKRLLSLVNSLLELEIVVERLTCPIFHLAGIRERDSAVSAGNDVSSAQATSTVTSNNDKVCYGFISLYHILIRIVVNFSSLFRVQMPKRDAIIQQLKGKELKDHEILSTDEFNKERDKLVTELEEL